MLASWVVEEMDTADLEDQRLNERLKTVLSALGERPTASIPAACGGHSEMVAAYRFFGNDKVTYERILKPHAERTRERIAAQPVVLLVQDTTELDWTRPQQQVLGAGSLDGSARRGTFLHPLVAFTRDGTPLGSCWATIWTRDEPLEETHQEKEQRRKATAIEDKESQRWLEGLRQARAVAQQVPEVQCVCIADSEADIYELFTEPRGEAAVHWLIRACQDRAIVPEGAEDEAARHLRGRRSSAGIVQPGDFRTWPAAREDLLRAASSPSTASQPHGPGRSACQQRHAPRSPASWRQAAACDGPCGAGL